MRQPSVLRSTEGREITFSPGDWKSIATSPVRCHATLSADSAYLMWQRYSTRPLMHFHPTVDKYQPRHKSPSPRTQKVAQKCGSKSVLSRIGPSANRSNGPPFRDTAKPIELRNGTVTPRFQPWYQSSRRSPSQVNQVAIAPLSSNVPSAPGAITGSLARSRISLGRDRSTTSQPVELRLAASLALK